MPACLAEEQANVVETKSPTPAELLQPPKPSTEESPPQLIVAKNVILFEGRVMGWADLSEELRNRATANGGDLETVGYARTFEAFQDAERTKEAQNWAQLLTDTGGVEVQDRGRILSGPARRYDVLEITDVWPPGAEHPICGRVVDADGTPVANAQVVLRMPTDPRLRMGSPALRLDNGRFVGTEQLIAKRSDSRGKFQFEFPSERTSVVIAAPEGFAAVPASSDDRDIALTPWSRVTANLRQDKKRGVQTVSLYAYVSPAKGYPTIVIKVSLGSPGERAEKVEALAAPPAAKIQAKRLLWKKSDGNALTGTPYGPAYEFSTESGMTHHLEFGPLAE
ncbi:carboxypeptidase-like regulatory domain-containing protein [Aeoliella sp. ICT_H6.2]|uniref:Carboxypeptidase-like regulatory domain-containing protein n=2 Tax=Aeoliella straminimaris TaxID=2954799 RepID=A0A9X2FEY0_9BACT|nr:carboxypeptidase-like regulatory domain-containing protein [Aeoliella straminimaris]